MDTDRREKHKNIICTVWDLSELVHRPPVQSVKYHLKEISNAFEIFSHFVCCVLLLSKISFSCSCLFYCESLRLFCPSLPVSAVLSLCLPVHSVCPSASVYSSITPSVRLQHSLHPSICLPLILSPSLSAAASLCPSASVSGSHDVRLANVEAGGGETKCSSGLKVALIRGITGRRVEDRQAETQTALTESLRQSR